MAYSLYFSLGNRKTIFIFVVLRLCCEKWLKTRINLIGVLVPRISREILFISLCISTEYWHAEKKSFTNRRRKWSHESVKSNSCVGISLRFCQVTNISWWNFRLSTEHCCRDYLDGKYYYGLVLLSIGTRVHSFLAPSKFPSYSTLLLCFACFLKVLRTFWARKASCQTAICLLWKADLFT